jgi:indole-3-glycerol phosphate synthase
LTNVPLLRKDFIIDEYQIYEARVLGADAILLITAALSPVQLKTYFFLAHDLGMSCLVEVHNQAELDTALTLDAAIIGINNRNLYTFETTLDITAKLAPMVPQGKVLVSESGINDAADIKFLQQYNVNAVLIGELLMRSLLPGQKLKEMVGAGDAAN